MTEIERKFLIEMPNRASLLSNRGAQESEILQTYLLSEKGVSARVRSRTTKGNTVYTHTEKIRISDLSHIENETEISEEEYLALLKKADPSCRSILKTRITFPHEGHLMEIDIYPFWTEQAILEIELNSEDEQVSVPAYIKILRDVSADLRFKNHALALIVPDECTEDGTRRTDT